jgi:dTDP-4-dehydrorhamnose 3,5-epimerase
VKRIETALPGVCLLEPKVFGDARGFFLESFNARALAAVGIDRTWVQDNLSRSARGVLRGLHYQVGKPQAKLVRVLAGEVYDVVVDVRRGSPTFGRWIAETLTADSHRMLYIPEGLAHGFCVVSETADFFYKVTDYYSPADERGVAWNDPALAIPWPVKDPLLSARDRLWKPLAGTDADDLP